MRDSASRTSINGASSLIGRPNLFYMGKCVWTKIKMRACQKRQLDKKLCVEVIRSKTIGEIEIPL